MSEKWDNLKKLLLATCDWPTFTIDPKSGVDYNLESTTIGEVLGLSVADGKTVEPKLLNTIKQMAVISGMRRKMTLREIEEEYPHVDLSEIIPFMGGKYPERDVLLKEHKKTADLLYDEIDNEETDAKLDAISEKLDKLPPRIEVLAGFLKKILETHGQDSHLAIHLTDLLGDEIRFDNYKQGIEALNDLVPQLKRMEMIDTLGRLETEMPALRKRVAVLKSLGIEADEIAFKELPYSEESEFLGGSDDSPDMLVDPTKKGLQEATFIIAGMIDKLEQIIDSGPDKSVRRPGK